MFAPTSTMITRYFKPTYATGLCYRSALCVNFFQMYVPNGVGAFGSTYKEIEDLGEGWNFYLTKTRWKYLDRPTHRCGEEIRYAWEFSEAATITVYLRFN